MNENTRIAFASGSVKTISATRAVLLQLYELIDVLCGRLIDDFCLIKERLVT